MEQDNFFKLPTIGVIGSHIESFEEYTAPLGKLIAERNYNLVVGGGKGVMSSTAKSFVSVSPRLGRCVGVIPVEDKDDFENLRNYSNQYVEIPIIVRLAERAMRSTEPLALNTVNILSSDVVVVLPGLKGTKMETSLALSYEKPVCFFGESEDFQNFPDMPKICSALEEVERFIRRAVVKT